MHRRVLRWKFHGYGPSPSGRDGASAPSAKVLLAPVPGARGMAAGDDGRMVRAHPAFLPRAVTVGACTCRLVSASVVASVVTGGVTVYSSSSVADRSCSATAAPVVKSVSVTTGFPPVTLLASAIVAALWSKYPAKVGPE